MNRLMAIVIAVVFTVTAGLALAQAASEGAFKAGDTIFVCGCGEGCPCQTISSKSGKCGCGKHLLKTSVDKVENGKVYYDLKGKQLSASTTGKFVCACGEGCKCNTTSQKAGDCSCGKPLKAVE